MLACTPSEPGDGAGESETSGETSGDGDGDPSGDGDGDGDGDSTGGCTEQAPELADCGGELTCQGSDALALGVVPHEEVQSVYVGDPCEHFNNLESCTLREATFFDDCIMTPSADCYLYGNWYTDCAFVDECP